jgi:hypothetical protein
MQPELLISVQVDWSLELGPIEERFVITEGRCEGAVNGRFRSSSVLRDGDAFGELRGAIDTDDGAIIRFRRTGSRIELFGDERHPAIMGPGFLESTDDGFAVLLQPRALAA